MTKNLTYKSYFIGLGLSIALTLLSYLFGVYKVLPLNYTYIAITAFAVIQLIVQIVYFLHINSDGKPHWNMVSFVFALIMIFIVVAGSLWVMYNLNENMM